MSVGTVLLGAFLTHCNVSYTVTRGGTRTEYSAKLLFIIGGVLLMLKGMNVI